MGYTKTDNSESNEEILQILSSRQNNWIFFYFDESNQQYLESKVNHRILATVELTQHYIPELLQDISIHGLSCFSAYFDKGTESSFIYASDIVNFDEKQHHISNFD